MDSAQVEIFRDCFWAPDKDEICNPLAVGRPNNGM